MLTGLGTCKALCRCVLCMCIKKEGLEWDTKIEQISIYFFQLLVF